MSRPHRGTRRRQYGHREHELRTRRERQRELAEERLRDPAVGGDRVSLDYLDHAADLPEHTEDVNL